jgi:hypothetical protein
MATITPIGRRMQRMFEDRRVKPNGKRARCDVFAPTEQNREVECCHCGWRYKEHEAVWERRGGLLLWWCKNEECDGAGVGFDLHPKLTRNCPDPEKDVGGEGLEPSTLSV